MTSQLIFLTQGALLIKHLLYLCYEWQVYYLLLGPLNAFKLVWLTQSLMFMPSDTVSWWCTKCYKLNFVYVSRLMMVQYFVIWCSGFRHIILIWIIFFVRFTYIQGLSMAAICFIAIHNKCTHTLWMYGLDLDVYKFRRISDMHGSGCLNLVKRWEDFLLMYWTFSRCAPNLQDSWEMKVSLE
jgi:hypothetical protein